MKCEDPEAVILTEDESSSAAETEMETETETAAEANTAPEANPEEQISALEEQVKQNYELYLKARAELENFRKRTQKDHDELVGYANFNLYKKLLPLTDDLERALTASAAGGDFDALFKGLTLIQKNLSDLLQNEGVEAITALDAEFDPRYHQSLMVEETGADDNRVVEEFQKGYIYKNRVLRPSLVKVSK
jgi:molecular chaperone GrpE